MDVPSLKRTVDASAIPIDRLASSTAVPKEEKLRQVSRHFEAILVRQILNDAHKPVHGNGALPETATTGIYRDLMTEKLADTISKSGQFGVSRSFEMQLTQQLTRPPGAMRAGDVQDEPRPLKAGPRSHLSSISKTNSESRATSGPENP